MNIGHLGGHTDIASEITGIPNNSIVFYVLFGCHSWLAFFPLKKEEKTFALLLILSFFISASEQGVFLALSVTVTYLAN